MNCKQCGEQTDKRWFRLSELAAEYHGDHDEIETLDAGVFDKAECIAAYLGEKENS